MTCLTPPPLRSFTFDHHEVRAVDTADGPIRLLAADVLAALGLDRKALERLDDDEKGVNTVHTLGGPQRMTTVTESGAWALALTSRKPQAKRFRRWVTEDVVPSIRRTGSYSVDRRTVAPASIFHVPQSFPEALRLAADLYEKNEEQAKQIEAQRPAVEFVDRFVDAKGSAGVREVAKRINREQNEFVAELLRDGVMYRSGKHLVPFAEYQKRGYFVVKNGVKNGHAFPHARFTPKGIEWAGQRYGRGEQSLALATVPKQASLL